MAETVAYITNKRRALISNHGPRRRLLNVDNNIETAADITAEALSAGLQAN